MTEWRFLLDENSDPKTATYLEKEDVYVERVRDVLGQGADDAADILPYARDHGLVLVTSDVSDFANLEPETHAGVVLLYDDTMPAYRTATALLTMIDAYPDRSRSLGTKSSTRGCEGSNKPVWRRNLCGHSR